MQTDKKIDPRYAIVVGACLTQFTVVGLMFSYSIFFKTFEDEFGWSRTTISAAMSLAFLVMGVLAGFMGHLGDRLGPKPVLAATGLAYGLGFALISQIGEPWQLFLIFCIFIGLGLSTHDVVTLSTVARCFDKRRGIMTGVVKNRNSCRPDASARGFGIPDHCDRMAIRRFDTGYLRRLPSASWRIPHEHSNDISRSNFQCWRTKHWLGLRNEVASVLDALRHPVLVFPFAYNRPIAFARPRYGSWHEHCECRVAPVGDRWR